jgi:hypothetical protein
MLQLMKKRAVLFICFSCFLFLAIQSKTFRSPAVDAAFKPVSFMQNDPVKAQSKTIKIISAEGGTYGYEIYAGGKLLIRQANIPGMSGNKGFKRKSDAEKVAKMVVEKLDKGIMPPTVEKAEMEKLKVQF